MTYMLDTNICIYAIKNKPEQVLEKLKESLSNGICISAITLAELQHGVEKKHEPRKKSYGFTSISFYFRYFTI